MQIKWNENIGENANHHKYWNDLGIEQKKSYYIDRDNYEEQCRGALNYAKQTGVYDDIAVGLRWLPSASKGISLASGICWEAGLLYDIIRPLSMNFVDYSKHRIHDMAPLVIRYFGLEDKDITLTVGDYYCIECPDGEYDFATMTMSLMMADYPYRLMGEVNRILKPGGKVLITGEPRRSGMFFTFRMGSMLLRVIGAKILRIESDKAEYYIVHKDFKPDESGAHVHSMIFYWKLFRRNGFKIKKIGFTNPRFWSFVLIKE